MTYKTYLGSSTVLFSLLVCMFPFYEFPRMTHFVHQTPSLLGVLPLIQVTLAASCLGLSAYAYIKKIEPLNKSGRPVTVFGITASSLCLLCILISLIMKLSVIQNLR